MKGKKNEFVFTIGFKRTNPEHVRVVNILNEMDSKNQFIVDAVLCYVDSGYMNVRPWNLYPALSPNGVNPQLQPVQPTDIEERQEVEEDMDQEDLGRIFHSLQAFRKD